MKNASKIHKLVNFKKENTYFLYKMSNNWKNSNSDTFKGYLSSKPETPLRMSDNF